MSNSKYIFNNTFAVIIGIDEYQGEPGVPKLKTAVADAKKLDKTLQERHKKLKANDNHSESDECKTLLITNQEATKFKLEELFENFKKGKILIKNQDGQVTEEKVKENDRLLFYFAGHGLANPRNPELKESYFLPQDAENNNVSSYLKMQDLCDALNKLECRHMLVILDCCFAGAFHYVIKDLKRPPKVYKELYDRFIQYPAWQVITSAAYNQKALDYISFGEREPIQDGERIPPNSPFAEALCHALSVKSGQQDVDENGDGIITAYELYSYLHKKLFENAAKNCHEQTPGIYPLRRDNQGEFIFLLSGFNPDDLDLAPAIDPDNNPYRGLEPYEEEHSDLFFGRDKTIKDLYKQVNQNALTVVVGAPGTAKSSVVNAGLIPKWRKLNDLQTQIDDLQKQEKQLKISNHLNEQEKDFNQLNQLKEDLEKLERQQENLKILETQEDELMTKIRAAILSQNFLDLQNTIKQQLNLDLPSLNEKIKILQKQEENIKEIEKWYNQEQINLRILGDELKEVKSVYSFLTKILDYLDDLQKRLRRELNHDLKENLQEIKKQTEEELNKIIEEKYKNKEREERIKKIIKKKYNEELKKIIEEKDKVRFKKKAEEKLIERFTLALLKRNFKLQIKKNALGIKGQLNSKKESLKLSLKNLKKQLETQLRWYIIRVRLGESPINALNNSLDINCLSEKPNTSNPITLNLENIIKNINFKLDKWKNYRLDLFSHKRLLVIDQFEEIFQLCKDEKERKEFLDWLTKAIEKNSQWLRIVLIVRSDSEPLFRETALKQYWTKKAKFVIPQMTRPELKQAIEEPATLQVVNFEIKDNDNLVDKLLDEVMQMQGALPLLSFFLHELYNKLLDKNKNGSQCRTFTIEDYKQLGGVTEVLNNKLESEYKKLLAPDPSNENKDMELEEFRKTWHKSIRNVILRIVTIDSYFARRRVSRSELEYPQPEENKRVDKVIEAFADAHLLMKERLQEQETVELAHDMILQWSKLMEWAKEADETVPFSLRRRLTQNAMAWKDEKNNNTKPKYLLRNVYELELLKKVSNSNDNWLNKFEHEFVQESEKQSQIEPLILKAEQVYEQLVNSEQSSQKSQSLTWEKTIRNVMLRMVAIDNNLAHQRVLISELEYPKEEENQRVNRVIDEFVSAGLLLQTPPDEKIYVEPVNDALMQKWDRLWTWKWTHKENLILLRQLTKAAVEWQGKNKERNLLWDHNPNLDSLKRVVNSEDDNWLNQLENEFVKESSRQKESSNRTELLTELTKLLGNLTKSPILSTLPLLILLAALVFWIFSSIQESSERISRTISSGEKILTTPGKLTWLKQAGVNEINTDNFGKAKGLLKDYLKKEPNDPEALIYLNNARIGKNNSYTIATSVPISSDINTALEILRGVAQAQDEINKAGGINGVPLRVLIADDNNNPNVAKQIAKKFIEDSKILGVVGHYSSDVTLAAGEVYNSEKLVVISPVSTPLTQKGFSKYIFRTVPSDAVAARALADYMLNRLGKKKAAVFYSSKSESSQSLKGEFVRAIASSKGQLANELVFDLSNSDFDANQSVERAIQQGAEVLVLLANTEELDKALLVVKANHKELPVLAGDDVYTPKILKEGAEDAVGMIVSVPWHILAEPKSDFEKKFVKDSTNIWRAPINWRTAMSYDATLGLISAIKQNPNPTREGIATTLLSTGFTDATGKIKFSSGERSQAVIQLVKIINTGFSSRSGYGYDFVPEN